MSEEMEIDENVKIIQDDLKIDNLRHLSLNIKDLLLRIKENKITKELYFEFYGNFCYSN